MGGREQRQHLAIPHQCTTVRPPHVPRRLPNASPNMMLFDGRDLAAAPGLTADSTFRIIQNTGGTNFGKSKSPNPRAAEWRGGLCIGG